MFEVFGEPQHPYTQGLLHSVPNIDLDGGELFKMEGTPPNLLHPPPGCSFHPRCPAAMDVCAGREPGFLPVHGDHLAACWLYQLEEVGRSD